MTTLYHDPVSRSKRVAWLIYELENLGIEDVCEIKPIALQKGEHKTKEFF